MKMESEIKEALEEMVWQFAFRGVKDNTSILWTGGLSALETAFEALGWDDPKFFEDMEGICDVEGCAEWVSSQGMAWRDTGYWCVCDNHTMLSRRDAPQPKMKQRAINREAKRDCNIAGGF